MRGLCFIGMISNQRHKTTQVKCTATRARTSVAMSTRVHQEKKCGPPEISARLCLLIHIPPPFCHPSVCKLTTHPPYHTTTTQAHPPVRTTERARQSRGPGRCLLLLPPFPPPLPRLLFPPHAEEANNIFTAAAAPPPLIPTLVPRLSSRGSNRPGGS